MKDWSDWTIPILQSVIIGILGYTARLLVRIEGRVGKLEQWMRDTEKRLDRMQYRWNVSRGRRSMGSSEPSGEDEGIDD